MTSAGVVQRARSAWALRVAIFAVSLLAAALAGELLWRSLRVPLGLATNPIPTVYDAEVGWRYQPNVRVRHRTATFDVTVRLDGQGRRVGERPRRPGAARAVFVGDSITLGWGVEEEESFVGLLREEAGLETVNLGTAGYGTDQSYLRLRRDGLALAPDVVVYTYCRNDPVETLHPRRYGRAKAWFRLEGGNLLGFPPRASFIERHSALYHSTSSFLARWEDRPSPAQTLAAQGLITRLVLAMDEASRRAGARFAVVYYDEPWLRRSLEGSGVLQVDWGPAIAQAGQARGPSLFAPDGHWSRRGNRLVAREIARALRVAGELTPGPVPGLPAENLLSAGL
jgi:lysophospholipase L1-like esterase